MLSPYEGTLGMMFNGDKLKEQLNKYIINNPEPLSYEIKENKPNDVKVVCILGKNEDEKDIEPFNHPFIFKDIKGKTIVAMDFRLFVKPTVNDDVINIFDVVNDKVNAKIAFIRLIFTKLMLENDIGVFISLNSYVAESLASLVDTIVTNIVYDKNVTDPAHIVTLMHYYSMDDGSNDLYVEDVISRLPVKETNKLHNDLKDLLERMKKAKEEGDFTLPSKTISDLIHNILSASDNERLNKLDVDTFINIIGRTFFCLNNKELAIAMTEHKPTLIAIIYIMLSESIGTRSLVRKVIDGRKMITKPKDMVKTIHQILEENIHKI